jgi:hypothetical protein
MTNTGLTEFQLKNIAWVLQEVRRQIPSLPDYDFKFKEKIFKTENKDIEHHE